MDNKKEIEILMHFDNLNHTTKRINQYLNYVLKEIYKEYFGEDFTFEELKNQIIKKDRVDSYKYV
jgi:hypothetical protein